MKGLLKIKKNLSRTNFKNLDIENTACCWSPLHMVRGGLPLQSARLYYVTI